MKGEEIAQPPFPAGPWLVRVGTTRPRSQSAGQVGGEEVRWWQQCPEGGSVWVWPMGVPSQDAVCLPPYPSPTHIPLVCLLLSSSACAGSSGAVWRNAQGPCHTPRSAFKVSPGHSASESSLCCRPLLSWLLGSLPSPDPGSPSRVWFSHQPLGRTPAMLLLLYKYTANQSKGVWQAATGQKIRPRDTAP